MAIDLPPKIPPAVIQYAKDHDYLPDEYKNINSDNAYTYIKRFSDYKGYEVYRLGKQRKVIAILDYKNCHIILHNKKETRCVNNEEAYELAEKDFDLSPTNIKPSVIEYVKKYGNTPDKYKNINIYNANGYILGPDRDYFKQDISYYNGYMAYFIGFPNVYEFDVTKCQILLEKNNQFHCASRDEHFDIMVPKEKALSPIHKLRKFINSIFNRKVR